MAEVSSFPPPCSVHFISTYGCYHSGILMEGVTRSQEFVTVRLSRQWKMHQAILGVGEGVKTEI